MKVKALAPWFGADRTIASEIGKLLSGCKWVGVPFGGGMSALAHIDAPSIVVSDIHRYVINLARVVACPLTLPHLARRLRNTPFHADVLKEAQGWCKDFVVGDQPDVSAAVNYFITQWMGRSGKAGIDDEFNGNISIRWNGNGGDSNTRYRSAVKSLAEWNRIMRRCNFSVLDCFDFLDRCEDNPKHGLYVDAPWPDDGDRYKHSFTTEQQADLAEALTAFKHCRLVIRYGDHPLIRRLYPEDRWHWRMIEGRTQGNNAKAEVLITRRSKSGLFD